MPGQPKPRGITDEIRIKRAKGLLDEDLHARNRLSHHNEAVKALYSEYLGKPGSGKSHEYLHTHYTARPMYNR